MTAILSPDIIAHLDDETTIKILGDRRSRRRATRRGAALAAS